MQSSTLRVIRLSRLTRMTQSVLEVIPTRSVGTSVTALSMRLRFGYIAHTSARPTARDARMTPHRVRITLRELMLGIAVVALLMAFPTRVVELFLPVLVSSILCIAIALAGVLTVEKLGRGRITVALLSASAVVVVVPLLAWRPSGFEAFFVGLTLINLAGPVHLVRKVVKEQKEFAGEILWAWLGIIWPVVWLSILRYGFTAEIEMTIQATQLSLVVALLLIRFGKRPQPPDHRWPHYLGWALFECDAIVWGWFASRYVLVYGFLW